MENLQFEFNDTIWVPLAPTFNDTIWALLATMSLAWVVDQNKSNFYKEKERERKESCKIHICSPRCCIISANH